MKVLWFTGVMPIEFSEKIGRKSSVIQGWVPSLIEAIRKYVSDIRLTVVCCDQYPTKATVGGVDYIALETNKRESIKDFANKVRKCVRSVKPDLIHLHGSENIYPSLPKETWGGIPVVMSLQGIINGCYPHATGGLLPSEMQPYIGIVRKLGFGGSIYDHAEHWERYRALSEREAFKNVRYIFGRTKWDKAWTKYLNPDAKYEIVGELMRAPFYQGRRDASEIKAHTIYCSAALGSPLKGGHWLIRAVAALKRKYPDIELRIASGDGCSKPKSLYGRLRQPQYGRYIWHLIDQLDVRENVRLLPELSAEEVANELRHAEVFCLPSLVENSPNSLGEAMLLGVPSVVTDVGGNSSLLRNGEDGLIVPSSDPAMLADAIDKIFSDKALALRLAEAGYESSVKRYSPEYVAKQLVDAYSSVMNRKNQ